MKTLKSCRRLNRTCKNKKELCHSDSLFINRVVNDGKHLVSSWLKEVEHVKEFIDKTPMKTSRQLNSDMYMKVDLGKNNGGKLLLYFAANPGNNIKTRRSKE